MLTIQRSDVSAAVWDGFVDASADGTIMHRYGWKPVLERAYRLRTEYLSAWSGGTLRGVLPLVLVRGLLDRGTLVSMPFMDYGGACTNGDDDVERALLDAATALAAAEGRPISFRYLRPPRTELPCSKEKVTMLLELGDDEAALWRRLPSERRNRINKGRKLGLVAEFPGAAALDDFYTVYATNMRDLGSPPHSRRFFAEVLAGLPGRSQLIIVRDAGRAVGAGLMLVHAGMLSMPWVSSLREFFSRCPNQVLYWEVMRWGLAHDIRVLDFGRSTWHSGSFEAKRQWGATPLQLHWHYSPADAQPPGAELEGLQWATTVWRHLPVAISNVIGARIRRTLPN